MNQSETTVDVVGLMILLRMALLMSPFAAIKTLKPV